MLARARAHAHAVSSVHGRRREIARTWLYVT